jgi:hypothetical protein
VGAHEHVDRVHLQQADAAHDPAQVPDVGDAGGRRIGEALRTQRDAAGLPQGERIGDHRRRG